MTSQSRPAISRVVRIENSCYEKKIKKTLHYSEVKKKLHADGFVLVDTINNPQMAFTTTEVFKCPECEKEEKNTVIQFDSAGKIVEMKCE